MTTTLAVVPMSVGSGRDKKRDSERRARERRAAKLELMRQTLDALEYATLVSSTLGDTDAVWDDFLDDRTRRVRQSLRLAQQTVALERERSQLQRLLEEHQLASHALAELTRQRPSNDWAWKVEHLRELVRAHYEPWTIDECEAEMAAALKEVNAFQWSPDKQTTGVSFLGWREFRRVDALRGQFQFQFSKTFKGYDVMDYVNVGWDAYTDAKSFKEVIMGHRLACSHEMLQQLRPNIVIVRGAQRFPVLGMDVHVCYLVFRVRTERGFIQCVRSIFCPGLQKAIDGPNDMWASNFLWFNWELLDGDEKGYTLRIGGSVGGKDMNYLNQWMFEALGCVLRSERRATGRQLITSD